MPYFYGSRNLVAADLSNNVFEGPYPLEYFNSDSFLKLEFVMANFNKGVRPPDVCVRYSICFKLQVQASRDANTFSFLEQEVVDIIDSSTDEFSY